MEGDGAGSDGEGNIRNNTMANQQQGSSEKKPKRQMKTPFQLETLEKTYAMETYPSESTRAELSMLLGLTDRQLQMWFCHRRLKDKKEAAGVAAMKPRTAGAGGRRSLTESPRHDLMDERGGDSGSGSGSRAGSGSGSRSGSGSGSSQFDNGDDMPMVPIRYYESPRTIMERRAIACVEAQLGQPLREDGPILGVEFDELPPGAFGAPIVTEQHRDRYRSYETKSFVPYDTKQTRAAASGHHEPAEPRVSSDPYGQGTQSHLYDSPVIGPTARTLSFVQGNGQLPRDYGVEGQVSNTTLPRQNMPSQFTSPPRDNVYIPDDEDTLQMERKRKLDEARIGKEVQAHEKRIRKELEKQDLLRRKMEEQMKKEMEKQDRERRKEEQRMMREQQRTEERLQREERREMERRERFMQKELIKAERKKQKEELRREKEAARQKAAVERAAARKIAKESMELIEDERLELMELAASSSGLSSIVSLDYDTLQNLDNFRGSLCEFPPKSVLLKKPFAIQPWLNSEDNVGNLLMVWKFCITFTDVLGLWPFTLDEFVQALHDYDSRLLGEIHVALLKLIVKDIEDVVRTPSGGLGTNQYTAINPEGGHPQIVEGAYLWGFDIRIWQKHLNPLTWPEVLRQLALSAGYGPPLKKKSSETACLNDNDESKGSEDIVSTLRNGSAAENAVAIMQEKGFPLQRKSRHRLTPGTVKFAAYHVLALEGSKGLNVLELADKIQKSGLRDLTTSKTPEASISVALSRDPVLFERIAPSTYCVRPAYRKDPADAETVISTAREKIQRFLNGFLAGQNADEAEKDDDSESDVAEAPEVDDLGTPSDVLKNSDGGSGVGTCPVNEKDNISDDAALQNGVDNTSSNPDQEGADIDGSRSGEPWVQGLTEGDYSDLSVEERLNALVVLVGVANEGNTVRAVLEDRLDAANALKKQMWAEAQLDKRRFREEIIPRFQDPSFNAAEGSQSPLMVADSKISEAPSNDVVKEEHAFGVDNIRNDVNNFSSEKSYVALDSSMAPFTSPIQQNGYTAERSRMQLKSFIGHRAEEMYVHRSLPLGQDRRRNRYWQFVASVTSNDPGSGRIFVESPDGRWKLIDSEEAFDALLMSLDTRGTRESHLHIMLQKVEAPFKARLRENISGRNVKGENGKAIDEAAKTNSSSYCSADAESPSSVVYGANSDSLEVSSSFKIELGRNNLEQKNALRRYQDLQTWMWKECFNSSVLRALAHGKKRCSSLLGICSTCLDSYVSEDNFCPFCQKTGSNFENVAQFEDKLNFDPKKLAVTNSSCAPRIRLVKALLAFLEVTVPFEALQSFWTEDRRRSWSLKLHSSSSSEDLLQVLTQLEGVIKRDYLSENFETTEELLGGCPSSRNAANVSTYAGSVPELPWIPLTSAAITLRLFELDSSISFAGPQKIEPVDGKKIQNFTKFSLKYGRTNDIRKAETRVLEQNGQFKVENWDFHNMPSGSGARPAVRGRGGRPRGRVPKGVAASMSESGRRTVKQSESLTQVLERTNGQRLGRGRRTLRRRRTERAVEKAVADHWIDRNSSRNLAEMGRNSREEELIREDTGTVQAEGDDDDDNSDSMEVVDYDDNAHETTYKYGNWDTDVNAAPSRSNDLMEMSDDDPGDSDEDNVYEEEDAGNVEGGLDMNDYSDRGGDDNEDDDDDSDSDSVGSGDYSD